MTNLPEWSVCNQIMVKQRLSSMDKGTTPQQKITSILQQVS